MKKNKEEDIIQRIEKVCKERSDNNRIFTFLGFVDNQWIGNNTKLILKCSIHGKWETTSYVHFINGTGCRQCSILSKNKEKMDKYSKEFLEKAKIIHKNKYDYSLVNYTKANSYINIICPIHGIFQQTPNSHLNGTGCPKCGKIVQAKNHSLTTEEFVRRSKEIHGDKYDYSKVNYINNYTDVCIICPIHGEFWQKAYDHLDNLHPCKECRKLIPNHKLLTTEEFVRRSKEIHGDKYDYSKTVYKLSTEKLLITCKQHGDFYQYPYHHTAGRGCPLCKNSIGEKLICDYLTNLEIKFDSQVRIKGEIDGKQSDLVIIDFSFEIDNQVYWIEYNGEQHYKFCQFFHRQNYQNFINQVNRDKAVRDYALERNIHFLEIPYLDIDRIPEILELFLYENKNIVTKINPKILPTIWIKQN